MSSLRRILAAAAVGVAVSLAVFVPASAAAAGAQCTTRTPAPAVPAGDAPPLDRLACADLRGLDLSQERLAGADLHGADLTGTVLLQADLTGADLTGANLTGADLRQATMVGANLRGANLTDARASQADLTKADLRGADLTRTELIQTTLVEADLTGTDLSTANTIQTTFDGAIGLPDDEPTVGLPPATEELQPVADDPAPAKQPAGDSAQLAYTLFWPAIAIALGWSRTRIGHLLRHRHTTPLRPADLIGATVGIVLVVTALYLIPVGVSRGLAHLSGGADWAVDPGPLGWLAAEPHWQLLVAAVALVLGGIDLGLARRRPPRQPATTVGQVAIGQPTPGRIGPEFGPPVRMLALLLVIAAVVDGVVVLVLLILGTLPATGLWQEDTVVGHLVFVVVAIAVLARFAANVRYGEGIESPSGAVLVGGAREPFLWLSGKSPNDRPVSTALPWESLEQVHLIRVLGTAHPTSAMITIRHPGADRPSEYPKELPLSRDQAAGLHTVLPAEMITEHTRAPSSN
ncbi:pentapeptide repeat-containing protein [Actinophytocola sediminis]